MTSSGRSWGFNKQNIQMDISGSCFTAAGYFFNRHTTGSQPDSAAKARRATTLLYTENQPDRFI
jgi:hypothetical protein